MREHDLWSVFPARDPQTLKRYKSSKSDSKVTFVRDAETTMFIELRCRGGKEKCPNTLFLLGNSMTMKFGKIATFELIVRRIVVISEAHILGLVQPGGHESLSAPLHDTFGRLI